MSQNYFRLSQVYLQSGPKSKPLSQIFIKSYFNEMTSTQRCRSNTI